MHQLHHLQPCACWLHSVRSAGLLPVPWPSEVRLCSADHCAADLDSQASLLSLLSAGAVRIVHRHALQSSAAPVNCQLQVRLAELRTDQHSCLLG